MNTFRTTLLTALISLAISTPRTIAGQDVKTDLAHMQGEWVMTSGAADGYVMPESFLPQSRRVCKEDEVTVTVSGQLIMKAKITIDPSRTPKTIDYQVIDGPTKGQKQLGIYELNGDTLKSCFGAPGAARPTDFSSKPGDRRTYSVWKREKM